LELFLFYLGSIIPSRVNQKPLYRDVKKVLSSKTERLYISPPLPAEWSYILGISSTQLDPSFAEDRKTKENVPSPGIPSYFRKTRP